MKKILVTLVIATLIFTGCQANVELNEDTFDNSEIINTEVINAAIESSNIVLENEQENMECTPVFFTHRGNIFSLKCNGDIELVVESRFASDLNVWEGYLYYLEFYESERTAIVRFDLENHTKEVLEIGIMSHLTVADGLIFYVERIFLEEYTHSIPDGIYTLYMRTIDDETRHAVFSKEEGGRFGHNYQYYEGYIYILVRPYNNIYRIDLDSHEKVLVYEVMSWPYAPFIIYDGYIYYTVVWHTDLLRRVNIEGENSEFVIEMPVLMEYRLHNGYVYFVAGENVYKVESDGTNALRIFEGEWINIAAISCNHVLISRNHDIGGEYQLLLVNSDGSMSYEIVEM